MSQQWPGGLKLFGHSSWLLHNTPALLQTICMTLKSIKTQTQTHRKNFVSENRRRLKSRCQGERHVATNLLRQRRDRNDNRERLDNPFRSRRQNGAGCELDISTLVRSVGHAIRPPSTAKTSTKIVFPKRKYHFTFKQQQQQ